ncbi:RIC1 domain-containing protein [Trichophyton interdigitale]|nr:RIC1 domain-containing protein [Trichophyton interdigitale]KAG5217267.1 RIC1 domain-containing protein [Trichophyton interdigitale]KAG8205716.1 RIC1 domain-containing protein [Trichophyton interdigitale]
MYWPNGVPRVYAVNGPEIQRQQKRQQQQEEEETEQDDSRTETTAESADEREQSNGLLQHEHQEIAVQHGGDRDDAWADEPVAGLCVSKSGGLFATMTRSSLAIWQTKPTAVVAAIKRSHVSITNYGPNVALLLRPDSGIIVVQTLEGYLITYSIATDAHSHVYQQLFLQSHSRRNLPSNDSQAIREVSLRFRVAIKVDAGISKAVALDNELMVATTKPAAIQLIRWTPDSSGNQTSTELLSRIPWLSKKSLVVEMVYDRAMNLLLWVTSDGRVYAVQYSYREADESGSSKVNFTGHRFHNPENDGQRALQVAVNARFSLFAVSCVNGEICVYAARDYSGNIPLSHKLQMPASAATMGRISFMSYSYDGYCLFAGYENGWTTWSVFGKPGGSSFTADKSLAESNGETWLTGVSMGAWIGGGSDILLASSKDKRIWLLEVARSALTGCFSSANLARALLQTGTEIILYRGHDLPDLTTISGKDSLWHHAQYPPGYLHAQWPIRTCCVSQDGRYVAVAGRRGLAHYSVHSNRWKTFDDPKVENSFAIQGGMCWYGHILIVAVEGDSSYELRMYSRELPLNNSSILYSEPLPAPAVFIGPSGEDSLLVYTYDNILYHYVINAVGTRISLVQVGQITFNGIVRAPARVRAISWILPEDQLRDGDPSQDVAVASVLFLVDGKLVLLQPSVSPDGALKYDMRVVAHDVEYYILMRDQLSFNFAPPNDEPSSGGQTPEITVNNSPSDISLRDSLWVFGGKDLFVWSDMQDVLRPTGRSVEGPKNLPIPTDFYPISILLNKGIVLGIEPEITQRRDVTFTLQRFAIRTQLFLPYVLQHNLSYFDTPSALSICHHFSHLSYFPHALEILLHHVLDEAVDDHSIGNSIETPVKGKQLLPGVLAFLQAANPPELYLDILVQCIRKTELRSWRTLFAYLPPPNELFEQALKFNSLKTAGGYLLVLQAFDDIDDEDSGDGFDKIEDSAVRLLRLASQRGDWELCGEIAQFLIALDGSGKVLKRAVVRVGLRREGPGSPADVDDGPIPRFGMLDISP